jgi:hypothetical protein
MKSLRAAALIIAFALVAAACSSGNGSTPIITGTSPDGSIVVGDTAAPNTPPPPPVCPADQPIVRTDGSNPGVEYFDEGPGLASVHMSQATFECATHAVIVGDADINRVAVAAVLATSIGAPLLIATAEASGLMGFETERLAPEQIIAVGDDFTFDAPEWTEVVTLRGDTASLAAQINSLAGFASTLPLPAEFGPATLITTVNAIESGAGLVPPAPAAATTTTAAPGTSAADETTTTTMPTAEVAFDIPDLATGSGETGVAILVDGDRAASALAAFASAHSAGATAALIDDTDLRAVPGAGRALQSMGSGPGSIQVFGTATEDTAWQLDVIRTADELPGGGFLILPRLLVALYGNPLTTALGALGEQGPAEASTRVQQMARDFSASEVPVLPTFEIIASVAAGSAGGDGDYSNEMPRDVLEPWIEQAAQDGVYVVLDLQSGRDSFTNQVKEYEWALQYPHVGIALDPEWRLKPDQVHLQQVGRVDASEVNEVIDWVSDLVRENNLPQKVFLVHQFREFMIENRESLAPRPEIQLMIQMDGQGPVPAKYDTWDYLTIGWENHPWRWGWKNFYDEDTPGGGLTPGQFFQLEPTAVFVSFQ